MSSHVQVVAGIEMLDRCASNENQTLDADVMRGLQVHAEAACGLLKSMAHEGRLTILCLLSQKELSVMELEESLDLRQPAVSQQLARLRSDNLVSTRRDGKMIYYSLVSDEVRAVVATLARYFGRI